LSYKALVMLILGEELRWEVPHWDSL